MLNYSTYIYLCRVYLKKTPIYFQFYLEIQHFNIQVYFLKSMLFYYLYIWELPY